MVLHQGVDELENVELKEKMTQGIAWNGIAQLLTRVFQFIVTIILARLLTPEDFGVIGMASLFIGFVAMFTEFGLSSAIIQKMDVTSRELTASFWISALFGVAVWLVSVAASPLIATFFGHEQLKEIISVSSLGLVIGSLSVTQRSILTKDMNFKALAIINIVSSLIYGAISMMLALAGFGVWSLVLGSLALSFSRTIITWAMSGWRPKFTLNLSGFGSLFSFSIKVFGSSLVNYYRANIDYLIIGKFLGASPLGFYTIAYKLADFPRNRLSSLIANTAFPVFSSVQEENDKVKYGYEKVLRLISLLIFPMLFGLLVMAKEFITVAYGPKWLPALVPLQILLFMGALVSISEPATTIIIAKGRPGLQLKFSILYALVLGGLVFIAVPYGINLIAVAVLVSTLIYALPMIHFSNILIGNSYGEYLRAMLPATIGSIIMVVALLLYRQAQAHILNLPITAWLLSAIIIGIVIYSLALRTMNIAEVDEALEVISRIRRKSSDILRRKVARNWAVKAGLDSPASEAGKLPGKDAGCLESTSESIKA